MSKINIQFTNGKEGTYKKGIRLNNILEDLFPNTFRDYIAARIDDKLVDLSTPLEQDSTLHLLTCQDEQGLKVFWHSASHILAAAVKILYPEVQLGIGPAISNGFYYDFKFQENISINDFPEIENKMQEIVNNNDHFERKTVTKQEAISIFKNRNEHFKIELINDLENNSVSLYSNGNFIDLCRGPHVPSSGYIKFFKLSSLAGAYWHGDERNPMMQRIYGIAYPENKTLKKHIKSIEDAKKRDHRKLGKKLNLFSFHEEAPGFPFWHNNGMIIINEIVNYVRIILRKHGYLEVKTPMILNEDLWHKSGHWENYKNNMYFTEIDEKNYAIKPMNCPGGLLIYNENLHSFRELPLKYSELGIVHRHEKSGVLHGLFRVRQFTQDDAHVFCTPDQLTDEIDKLIDLVYEIYNTFGFSEFLVELSTKPSKSIGTDEMWERAETALASSLQHKKITYQLNKGEGAFYGPKIDFHIKDSLERMWQCGTIQVDFSMPERFNLEYVGSDGNKHRPVLVHRAILGSVERFIGILIEHYEGNFPVWLSPEQCRLIPVSEDHRSYADTVSLRLVEHNIRCTVDNRDEKVGYKIRSAENQKIPYMCIVGDKEINDKTVSLRKKKKGNLGEIKVNALIKEITQHIKRRTNNR
ncbi:MAG: threonine--tRNA ligase [bacterium]